MAPSIPIIVIAAPADQLGRTSIVNDIAPLLPEYRLVRSVVDSAIGVAILPATVLVRNGKVVDRRYGIIGPKRRARLLAHLAGGENH